ncbi:hypothetical protein [Hazenella coriacea]|uniref:DoxX-like protein n=1 Tax=Hazenella coriacea TaxID=1179467 RepID=A0A4R3L1B3_9BACL|nr:hypothetical protein [Hazenella coriacea]TCS91983.1 hypothetical protein EDD58_1203 [Hazenella coriacea]
MKRLFTSMKKAFPTTLRLYLGIMFLIYGLAKIVMGQFGEPAPTAIVSQGEGFALAWTFFGYSRFYELVIGWGEVIAAILIMIPRTSTLGAVMYFPISINVMLVNYCFNIGVQDLSTVLVIMNVILLWMDRKKLLMIFWKADQLKGQIEEKGVKVS